MRPGPRWKPVLLFALLLALFPAIGSLVAWVEGESMTSLDWLGILAFPLLAWLWLRHFSILGCKGSCLSTDEQGK